MNSKLLLPILAVVVLILVWSTLFGGLFTQNSHEVSIAVAGDVSLANNISTVVDGKDSVFKGVSNVTSDVDLLLFNFENAATYSDSAVRHKSPIKCEPRFVDLIHGNDNTVAALANNHILDFGIIGMRDTLSALDKNHISHLGVGEDENQAHQNVSQKINDRTITIFNYMDNSNFDNYSYDEMPYAKGLAPGYSGYDSGIAQKQISEAKEAGDFVIVYMHFGNEFSDAPTDDQKRIAHELIDYGADVVVGSNPHVAQGIEMYNKRPIFYSLGDFVSDLGMENASDTYLVKFDLVGDTCNCTVYPVHLNNCIPYFSETNDGNAFLNSLNPHCGELQINNGVGKLQFNLTRSD